MSLLRRKDSVLHEVDDLQSAGWSKLSDDLDGHDDFPDDADADDLSFIYEDDPPVYRAEPSVAGVDNLRDSSPDSLPRHFNALNIAPNTDGNLTQQRYYPGIDVCIVGSGLLSICSVY